MDKKVGKLRPVNEPGLTTKLGDFIPALATIKIEEPILMGVEALKVVIASWKRNIRQAIANSILKAIEDVENQTNLVEALAQKGTNRSLEEAKSRLHVIEGLRYELEERKDWVWRDEVEPLLTSGEKVFIGMWKDEAGNWHDGFWRFDVEVAPSRERRPTKITMIDGVMTVPAHQESQARRYVDFELIDRASARKMYQLESVLENKNRKKQLEIVNAFIDQWKNGTDNPFDVEEED